MTKEQAIEELYAKKGDDSSEKSTNQLPEAPASATVKIKSPQGFEWLFTIRDQKASVLSFKMRAMENNWLEAGFTPLAQNQGYPKKETRPIEYVQGRVCPNDSAQIIIGIGKVKERCSNYKFDFTTKKNVGGCNYILWI